MAHNFKDFPELPNSKFDTDYVNSPHRQIVEDFQATVVKVHDGDTLTVSWTERDFNFPIRIVNIDAKELNEPRGHEQRDFLKGFIEGELVQIIVDPDNRVEKWGRLLADIMHRGLLVSELMLNTNNAVPFDDRKLDELPNIDKEFNPKQWFKV